MDGVVRTYLWASVLFFFLFFIFSSTFVYWLTNRVSTFFRGPKLYDFSHGGPTLSGVVVHSILFAALIFGVIDYIYGLLNGSDDSAVVVE
jgi:hypothetical protein